MSKPEAGDTVRVTIEGVLYQHNHGLGLPSYGTVYHNGEDRSLPANVRVDVLKKAKRTYKVGDTLTGAELKARQWKRGTIIANISNPRDLVLLPLGEWMRLEDEEYFPFSSFRAGSSYAIKYLPE